MVSVDVKNLNVWFGKFLAVKNVTMQIPANEILTIIGPSRSGKTTLLRTINRLNELTPGFRMSGDVRLGGRDLRFLDVEVVRRRVGMVFALPLPLPLSIFDNVAYGMRMRGLTDRRTIHETVEESLKKASIWEEVKDRLEQSAFTLSGGQQQRLCIARTLAVGPDVILFDEPCSGLDPISTAKVEETMMELKKHYTIVLVTNNVKQAARVGDQTAFFLLGELVEMEKTHQMFTAPREARTSGYIEGKFG
jgi:phosphate transport system ATP-binding protein